MGVRGCLRNCRGQMTIELAVGFPVLLVIAVIAVNALDFFSVCASMDRAMRNEACAVAVSPAAGQDLQQSVQELEQAMERNLGADNIECAVSHRKVGPDLDEFTATLKYHPTLFGLGLRREVWGVALPSLSHATSIVVDCYKPGVLI